MPRRAWITEVRGLGGGGGRAVGVWKADKGRQGQSQESKLCPAQTGGVDHDPLVWYDHLFVCLSV